MEPDLIVKYLFSEYTPYLKRIDAVSRDAWGKLIFPENPGTLDYNHFNKLKTQSKPTTPLVRDALRDERTQRRIASGLSCQDLFSVESFEQLEAALRPNLVVESAAREKHNGALILPAPFADGANCIGSAEESAINSLMFWINEPSAVTCWTDAPAVGSLFIAYALGGTYLPNKGKKDVYLICPFAGYTDAGYPDEDDELPFERSLKELRAHFELAPESSADRLWRSLESRNALLVVVHADLMSDSGESGLKALLRSAASREKSTARLLLMGKPAYRVSNCRNFNLQVAVSKEAESNAFFERQWKRYCGLRGHVPADEHGTRLQRAQSYYTADKTLATRPASVRMLAFLASNYESFSYFDPTAGWAELANMPADLLPVDIRLHVDEVNAQLRSLGKDHVIRAVEWCSTALYWLTQKAAEELIRTGNGMKWETFRSAVNEVHGRLITTESAEPSSGIEGHRTSENYKMDLATRALVQERWMRRDPLGRAEAHFVIAKRLYEHCNDKALLTAEFPFEPHWGRSRLHFLAECVRHLIRSCAPPEHCKSDRPGHKLWAALAMEFPKKPTQLAGGACGCDPYEVVNFCFEKIFWHELNGNRQTADMLNRKLALQHGLYQLTGELLELMSKSHQLGRPHDGLHPDHHARYHREVVYARLDLGQLQESLHSCNQLVRLSGNGMETTTVNVEHHVDRIVVLTAMNRLEEAERVLARVEAFVNGMKVRPEKIDIRLKARRGHLQYLRREFTSAIETYEKIATDDPAAITRDVAHAYIATLGALGTDEYLQRALTVCLQSLFHHSSSGQHHTALGFRIAFAHLLRKTRMLDAAEATLDQVQYDILKEGCSERTYLAFLLEAGRIVAEDPRRVARAYAAYLRPCLDRAVSLGYVRTAETALEKARRCLEALRDLLSSLPGEPSEHVRMMLFDARGSKLISRRPVVDPRYAFGSAQVEAWLPRLSSAGAIERELEELASMERKLEGAADQLEG
ncbi:hypothetical protein ACG04Q_21460 [Roseateles sp. DXS20W]|uniref:Tetratricopeptide repeat protein n=1 Tax=Pelomonas lactea TaxID=3299030 RepID=A0ABW7GQA3_9BURK